MATLSLLKKDLPFLLDGKAQATVETGTIRLNQPIAEDTTSVLSVSFTGGADPRVSLGRGESVTIGISADASVDLRPVFKSSPAGSPKILTKYGLGDFFKKVTDPANQMVLCLEVGASGDVTAAGSFPFATLKASAQIAAGANGGFAYLRAFDRNRSAQEVLTAFFSQVCLPDQMDRAPEPGEAVSLQYAGYLRLAAEVSAGYKLSGTKSFALGQLALSEKYNLSVIGKLGLSASVAGHFSILITAPEDLPGWARVQVRRHRASEMRVAADVDVALKNELAHLPPTAHEFLGAALGVNAKNFLTIFAKAVELSDLKKFEEAIDGLAKKYIEEVVGAGFDSLAKSAAFTKFMNVAHRVVESYESVEDRAVALFDRYFDRLDQLTAFLQRIQTLTDDALEGFRKELSPELWSILAQLTDGDPLAFLLHQVTIDGKPLESVTELKTRATAALDLIQNSAHEEIRRAIGVAKANFALDRLLTELARVDTADELEALANERIGLFVTRLVGRTLESSADIKQAFNETRAVLTKIDSFSEKLFGAFKEAASSSYKLALHAEYSKASDADALIDVAINMKDARAARLLAQAGKGDFDEIVVTADTDFVRLREGVLTHTTRRRSAFNVNIVGWHLNYRYSGFDQVITGTEQRLVPSAGGITVLTTSTLGLERQRKRQDEEVHMNFLLRALGESAGVVKSGDDQLAGYLIDGLRALSARYQLEFTDADTTSMELRDYLAFARDVGLDTQGAVPSQLEPLLPLAPNGGFGNVTASYDVRFGETALDALLTIKTLSPAAEAAVRSAMRLMVLANYLKGDALHDVAFSYATPGVHEVFVDEGPATFTNRSERTFAISLPNSSIAAPSQVVLSGVELELLQTLYGIENNLVAAMKDLFKVLNGGKVDPGKFEKSLGKFGSALQLFDRFDQTTTKRGVGTNTVFAMFDTLVRLASKGKALNLAALHLTSDAGGKKVEKVFLSEASANED